ncbi:unnamed protein product [Dovyalis caffra]|uniref:Uncharacterized protein n=1 Tax=Dovyalis caffra TaxID=77055 RepID=A0AAV1RZR2_9ROSI|nr:unnamed protein product [Dovyalis caffra]
MEGYRLCSVWIPRTQDTDRDEKINVSNRSNGAGRTNSEWRVEKKGMKPRRFGKKIEVLSSDASETMRRIEEVSFGVKILKKVEGESEK